MSAPLPSLPGLDLERPLGTGAFAEVFLGTHRASGVKVAVKLLARRWTEEPGVLERFRREAKILHDHPHPALVRLLGARLAEPPFFLALAYLPGGHLEDRLASGPLSPMEVRDFGIRVAAALAHLHDHQILHRDVKPANVLLDGQGRPVLGDLGLGKGTEDETLTGQDVVVGTPRYLAPELLRAGERHSPASDLYALGLVLAHALTGVPPGRKKGAPPLSLALATHPARRLAAILEGALRLDPADRPASVRAFGEQLAAFDAPPGALSGGPSAGAAGETVELEPEGGHSESPAPPGAPAPRGPQMFPAALQERYEPRGLLGRGGAGAVFRAHDRELDRPVAIKLLLGPVDEKQRERFLREARGLSDNRHPNIVALYDFGVADEVPYLVLELLEGKDLNHHLGREGALDRLLPIADALEALHGRGLLHRDLKPANIMLDAGERPVLTDFGLILDPDQTRLTKTGAVSGTLAYMSPEVLRGGALEPPADWWAFGVTLYVLCEQHLPWSGDSAIALALESEEPRLEFEVLDESAPEAKMIRACLQRDPDARPRSRADLDFAAEAPTGTYAAPATAPRPPAPTPPLPGPSRRAARAAVVGVAVTAAVALGLRLGDGPAPAPPEPPLPAEPSAAAPTRLPPGFTPEPASVRYRPGGFVELAWDAPARGRVEGTIRSNERFLEARGRRESGTLRLVQPEPGPNEIFEEFDLLLVDAEGTRLPAPVDLSAGLPSLEGEVRRLLDALRLGAAWAEQRRRWEHFGDLFASGELAEGASPDLDRALAVALGGLSPIPLEVLHAFEERLDVHLGGLPPPGDHRSLPVPAGELPVPLPPGETLDLALGADPGSAPEVVRVDLGDELTLVLVQGGEEWVTLRVPRHWVPDTGPRYRLRTEPAETSITELRLLDH